MITPDPPARDTPDWRGIEREYRLGQLFLAEIAAGFGVGEAAIRRRARAEGWERGTASGAASGADEADLAARRGLEVARAHRRLLAGLRETLGLVQQSLRDHLSAPTGPPDEGPFAGKAETVAGLVRALGTTADRLIRLERQAFGLENAMDGGTDDDSDAADIRERLQQRLARLAVPGDPGPLPGGAEQG
ncbi:hypothetical protein [Zavarzinia compransoris]|uniref:Terminase n=1 Tax=Zavarzinia compransoris TaxID=1264899 RepID=A0A317DZ23_9PROT|nr:hypothetical protein [Zavarzinia compransoris]PWR19140.1 hypothetical protein DKG75_19495 [Zavarzinia compransoris]TDP49153.1 hypothetical protein DES42_101521 [Zavarzinia compransoris]